MPTMQDEERVKGRVTHAAPQSQQNGCKQIKTIVKRGILSKVFPYLLAREGELAPYKSLSVVDYTLVKASTLFDERLIGNAGV